MDDPPSLPLPPPLTHTSPLFSPSFTMTLYRVVSLLASGLNLGVLGAYLASPALIQATSWEDIFHVYGGLGLAWLALWLPIAKDRPSTTAAARVGKDDDG